MRGGRCHRIGSAEVLEALCPLLLKHGSRPDYTRSDSGPELRRGIVPGWLQRVGIQPLQIYPGSPWENGYNERFNGTRRYDVLNAEWFATTRQRLRSSSTNGSDSTNRIRPHHALGKRPPVPEAI